MLIGAIDIEIPERDTDRVTVDWVRHTLETVPGLRVRGMNFDGQLVSVTRGKLGIGAVIRIGKGKLRIAGYTQPPLWVAVALIAAFLVLGFVGAWGIAGVLMKLDTLGVYLLIGGLSIAIAVAPHIISILATGRVRREMADVLRQALAASFP